MARCKVKNEDLKELAEIYNSQEKKPFMPCWIPGME